MDSLASGEQIQAVAYRLASLSPKGLSFAIDAIAIALGLIAIIALSMRLYVRLGFSAGLSRPLGPDDFLAVFGTVSCPSGATTLPAGARGAPLSISAMELTRDCQPAHILRCDRVHRLRHPLWARYTGLRTSFATLSDSSR